VALALLGRPDLAGHGVAGAQVEAADLRGRDVDVICPGQVVVIRGTQKTEAVGQDLDDALGRDLATSFALTLEDGKDELLPPQAADALDAELVGQLGELLAAL